MNSGTDTEVVYEGRFDWAEEAPPTVVIEAVTEVTGKEADELDTLYEYIDPDAMDRLLTGTNRANDISLSFRYATFRVTAAGDGHLVIEQFTD